MLVLSRKRLESIVIGDEIVITIMDIGRGRVQVGVKAPPYLPVYRREVVERMIAKGEIDDLECLDSNTKPVRTA